jgi:predicted RNA-binding protein with RPS1 domain
MATVKVYEIDSMGRLNLSIKRASPDYKPAEHDDKPLRKPGGGPRPGGSRF